MMKRTMLFARSNVRKAKGQTIAIIVLVLLSSAMMNLWLMLSMDYERNFERYHDKLNDGHITLAAYTNGEDFKSFLTGTLDDLDGVTGYCISEALCTPGTFAFDGGEIMANFAVLEKEEALLRPVGTFEIAEEGSFDSGVYLPVHYRMEGNYAVGDTIALSLGGGTYSYTVCGFFHTAMTGTHNCGIVSILLTEDRFCELAEKGGAAPSTLVSVRIQETEKNKEMDSLLLEEISKAFPDTAVYHNCYSDVWTARYISPMICAGVMSAMACLVLLIGVVVISSNVVHMIQEQMQNLGALKAVGYTSRQLIVSLLAQFAGITVVTGALGCLLSYCVFPAINEMMTAQTGVPYEIRFLPMPCMITIVFISAVVVAAVYLSAKRMRKIEPIVAIRQGVATHNFKKNPVPLERTSLPVHAALAMKTTLSGFKQNVVVGITMLVISLILVFSGVMFENVIRDMQPFIDMIAGESADSYINVNRDMEEAFLDILAEDDRVEKRYLYHTEQIQHVGGLSVEGVVSDDFTKLNNQSVVIEGRFPEYENEAAVAAKYARENGLHIGDEITLKAGAGEYTYLITGFVQTTNHLGRDCALTREGYGKIGELQSVTYYLNLSEGTDIDGFNDQITERLAGSINASNNIQAIIKGSGSVYVALLTMIVAVVMVLSVLIVLFVMYLLVRTLLNGKKREYGILKALGYTTGQLVLQTALSFMPAVIFSVAVGMVICARIINPLLAVFLGGLGIVKCTFTVPVWFNLTAGAGLILFAFAAACLISLRVKKIAPRELLSGE